MFTAKEYIETIQAREEYIPLEKRIEQCKEEVKRNTEQFIQNAKDFCEGGLSNELRRIAKDGGRHCFTEDIVLYTPESSFSEKYEECCYKPVMRFVKDKNLANEEYFINSSAPAYDYYTFENILKQNGYLLHATEETREAIVYDAKIPSDFSIMKSAQIYCIKITPIDEF